MDDGETDPAAPRTPDPAPLPGFPVLGSEQIYDSPWCGLRRDELALPDGATQDYHVVEISDAVVVVPIRDDGQLVMLWQHRHPHGGSHWEVPAGRVAEGEHPDDAAARELREETGYVAEGLERLAGFFPINGISAHYGHVYVARGCRLAGPAETELTERLEVHTMRVAEALQRLADGELQDGFTALALFHWVATDGLSLPRPRR